MGESLIFGFIFGGFAKGYATLSHDIDMFVCIRNNPERAIEEFRRWYFDVHTEFGLPPDMNDPGEVVTLIDLEARIEFLERTPLRREIETYDEYESILWGDVMSEAKLAIVGDMNTLAQLESRCKVLAARWRSEVLIMLGQQENPDLAKLDLRRLFKKAITYLKKDPPPRLAENPPLPRWAQPPSDGER